MRAGAAVHHACTHETEEEKKTWGRGGTRAAPKYCTPARSARARVLTGGAGEVVPSALAVDGDVAHEDDVLLHGPGSLAHRRLGRLHVLAAVQHPVLHASVPRARGTRCQVS